MAIAHPSILNEDSCNWCPVTLLTNQHGTLQADWVSWAWWDWPLTSLTNRHPSVLWHCWLGHLTRKIVSEITYNVSSGTLNSTIPIPSSHQGLRQWTVTSLVCRPITGSPWAPKCLYVKWQLVTANYMHSRVLDRLSPVDAVIAKAHVFNVSFAAVTKYNAMWFNVIDFNTQSITYTSANVKHGLQTMEWWRHNNTIVIIALSGTIFELFYVEEGLDLEKSLVVIQNDTIAWLTTPVLRPSNSE